ncbi:unnamed protein product [Nezara viridula]|uniref:Uncharacterized protein n=1 Tax=Nezara viridula TaxID=85310 RepID=A0A9P0E820_NEZVI|nr:unnamed protein product [Nezara viridula]
MLGCGTISAAACGLATAGARALQAAPACPIKDGLFQPAGRVQYPMRGLLSGLAGGAPIPHLTIGDAPRPLPPVTDDGKIQTFLHLPANQYPFSGH